MPLVLGAFPQLNFLPAWPILLAYMLLLTAAILVTHGLARVVIPSMPMVMISQDEYDVLVTRATRAQMPSFVGFLPSENSLSVPVFQPSRAYA